jgi:hypothetical protein
MFYFEVKTRESVWPTKIVQTFIVDSRRLQYNEMQRISLSFIYVAKFRG